MSGIQIFKNNEFGEIRTIINNNDIYFVGADVAKGLGYKNTTDAIRRHVDKEDKADVVFHDGSQNRNLIGINESGLYSLILSSELPNSKQYKRWVTSEVLPSIRKHGAYLTNDVMDKVLTDLDFGIKLLTELKKEREEKEQLKLTATKQQQIIGELKPRADYTDRILKNTGLVTITQIAKDYGMSGQAMNELLHKLRVQYKQSGQWLLYRDHQGKGYTHSETIDITRKDGTPDIRMNTKWTQKGRLFLYELLKDGKIYPDIEKSA